MRAETSGAVAVLFIVILPVLLVAAGAAIDLAQINAERRYVQSGADLAALSAAHHLTSAEDARSAARRTVAANAVYPTYQMTDADIVFGSSPQRGRFVPAADQTSTVGVTAVQVQIRAPARLYLLNLFMSEDALIVERSAVAAVEPPRVSFSLSNCLATLRLLDPILRPLIGVAVDALCSGRGLDTRVDLFPMLSDLAVSANLLTPSGDPVTYGEVLDADLPVASILTALTGIPVPPAQGRAIRLGDVLVVPADLRGVRVDTPVHAAQVQAGDLVLASAELLAMNVVSVDTTLTLGPFANVQAAVRVSEPRRIVMNVLPGSPEAYAQTSQIRVELDRLSILGIFTLRLNLRLANARATLSDEGDTCAMEGGAEIAVFDPVDASLIDLDLMTQVTGLPVGSQALGMHAETESTRETRRVSFTRQQYLDDPVVRFGPTGIAAEEAAVDLLTNRLSSMLDQTAETIQNARSVQQCTSLLGCLGNVVDAVGALLSSIASSVLVTSVNIANGLGADGTLTNALLADLIGLQLARADLELLEVVCGSDLPRLVR